MNLIKAEVKDGRLTAGNGALDVPVPSGLPTKDVLVGVRPEHLHAGPPPDGGLSLSFTLDALEPVGAETYLHGRLDGTSAGRDGTTLIARVPGKASTGLGTRLTIGATRDNVHFFDVSTGKRLG
jgi:ABC-type sugar transport system ATPase subunit